jgi:hypothetical protein
MMMQKSIEPPEFANASISLAVAYIVQPLVAGLVSGGGVPGGAVCSLAANDKVDAGAEYECLGGAAYDRRRLVSNVFTPLNRTTVDGVVVMTSLGCF